MGFKKRGAIYSVIALMLCVAVYLNYEYAKANPGEEHNVSGTSSAGSSIGGKVEVGATNPAEEEGPGIVSVSLPEDYFSEARLSRQKARDEAVNILTGTIESANATEEARAVANTNIQLLADNAMTESRIENLVIAKGYKDCVVFINDGSVNVIVAKTEQGLSDTDVAKIKDIVIDEVTATGLKIKVLESE